MAELIAIIIFLISVMGMGVVVLRKIPVLSELTVREVKSEGIISAIKSQIKDKTLKDFPFELYLQKFLSKIRVLVLKTEKKIGDWLNHLRQRNIEKKNNFTEDYWDKLKK